MKIELTEAEALVLADWLYKNGNKKELFDDIAEQYVLWHIDCQLEKELAFTEDYADAIAQARETVKKNY